MKNASRSPLTLNSETIILAYFSHSSFKFLEFDNLLCVFHVFRQVSEYYISYMLCRIIQTLNF